MKAPRFFIDDESGEPWQLFADGDDLELGVKNVSAYVQVALENLRDGKDGDEVTLTFKRQDMTEEEVAALPEL